MPEQAGDEPLVSIVLTTFNGERFLREQIQSVLDQSYRNLEIIAADDCSTDRTPDILRSYSDPRLRVHVNQRNLGCSANFEAAARMARGRYICPADQDDVWHPGKVETLLGAVGDAALAYAASDLIDERGMDLRCTLAEKMKVRPVRGRHPMAFYFANCVPAHAMLVRRDVLERALPIPPGLFHDRWVAYVASLAGEIRFVDEPLVSYRQHQTSVIGARAQARRAGSLRRRAAAKRDKSVRRNQELIGTLTAFRDAALRAGAPHAVLDQLIAGYEQSPRRFINGGLFRVIYRNREELFYMSRKARLMLALKEARGERFYRYIPVS